ncbi:MAG TPA: heme exporter protein CcmD [Hydrogenophaga sp.]
MQEFLSMGGYGAYVWPSYGLTAVVLLVLLVASLSGLKSTEAEFARLKALVNPQKPNQQTETSDGDEA